MEEDTNWHIRYKEMVKELKLSNEHISKITGNTTQSIRCVTHKSRALPRWIKLSIVIFEKYNLKKTK